MAPAASRWVCLDVGETLIDETRVWTCWALALDMTPFTFMSAMGAVLARGGEFRDVFAYVGRPDWERYREKVNVVYGGFQPSDLYPDAITCLSSLHDAGYRIAILANQPPERSAELRALGVEAEVIAMSSELGLYKPAPEFFSRSLELIGAPAGEVAYVGDRLDNDVLPSAAAGMRPVWLRRGPWALIQAAEPPAGTLVVDSLDELVARIGEVW